LHVKPSVSLFLALPENKPIKESNLEHKLLERIEDFLLELGRGFMFVGTQQRVTIGNVFFIIL
jgi:predicted nuclease of restriction endonuclease-like (RecB) superfamily